eukprot:SAG11_NODE_453_length_9367_cov_7.801575_2_plen_93_part_00
MIFFKTGGILFLTIYHTNLVPTESAGFAFIGIWVYIMIKSYQMYTHFFPNVYKCIHMYTHIHILHVYTVYKCIHISFHISFLILNLVPTGTS